MDEALMALRISSERFYTDFEALAQIGATGDGGVHRPALSETHLAARQWFKERIMAAGLEFRFDSAGNHSAFLACGPQGAPTLMLGSHLDTVPYGGRFDGALGVLAALEALRVVKEAGMSLPVHLEAMDFTDEEGTLVGLLGSAALAGVLHTEALRDPRGGRAALEDGFARAGLTEAGLPAARRAPGSLAAYLELHIEQGLILVNAGADIGVVTSIAGINSYRLTFLGRADHAGTTGMTTRKDASLGASSFVLAARTIVVEGFPRCAVNIGDMKFSPGAFNIIPARAELALEFRAPEADVFGRLEEALLERARVEAERFGLGLEVEWLGKCDPAPMSRVAQRAFVEAADALQLGHIHLASGAGHDAQSLVDVCPIGMVFVPSAEGASHSAREFTKWEHCVSGANVLLQGALRMANRVGQQRRRS
jgi:N-carbamoyl-L-amino-acid hydrolase